MLHLCLLLLIVVLSVYYLLCSKPAGLPPGPSGWPIVGCLFQLGENAHVTLTDLAGKYGDVYSIRLGLEYIVVLCGYDVLKEALVKKAEIFSGRPYQGTIAKVASTTGFIFQDYGPLWKEQRKFALAALRNFGVGKKSLESRIHDEIDYLITAFSHENEAAFNPKDTINTAVSNIICSLCFGCRYNYTDANFRRLLKLIDDNFKLVSGSSIGNYLPFLVDLPFMYRGYKNVIRQIKEFIMEKICEHRESFKPDNIRDIIDMYIVEIDRRQKIDAEVKFTDFLLYKSIHDLFTAGTDTTTSTLLWGLVYMVTHPEVQKKIQDEIDDKIGHYRLPSVSDKESLPYTMATIMEVQRLGNVAPISRHCATKTTDLLGYTIPAGTAVYANYWSAHFDKKYWDEPEKFQPERFLDSHGNVMKREAFVPFGTGRRICLGEQLARMELFLFFSALLQKFTFKIPQDSTTPSLVGRFGTTMSPDPFLICAISR